MSLRLSLVLLLATAAPLAGQRSLAIERFESAIRVEPSGIIDVTETITARFTGQWNGIYRAIPVEYRTPQGFNWTLGLDLTSATDENGRELRTDSSREGHYEKFRIWVPGALDATRTIVLRYRASNGLRFFEDHDELYWNVTGDEWEVPIEAASATIELPSAASGVRAIAYNGPYGSTARDATVEVEGTTIRVTMPKRLEFREGLTAVVGWDKGLVAEPTSTQRAAGFLRSNWPLVIPIPVFFLAWTLWRRRGRDPRRRPVAVRYEPPESLTPAEAGTLMDHSADMRDITATMVDLAVRGFIRIEETEEKKLFGLISDRDYRVRRVQPPAEWDRLAPHERKLLEGIFEENPTSVELSELEDEFYTHLDGIRDGIFDRLTGKGLYHARPDKVRERWMIAGVALGILIAAGGGALFAARFSLTPVPFVVAGILTAVILLAFGSQMPARSERGTRTLEHVLGFEEFLRRVESEHFAHVVKTPELFDKYLPFAMAFGVEKKWARAFADIYTQSPAWYAGTGPVTSFNPGHFSSRLADFSSRAGSTLASSPRSSSGSGFSGGGSSGGGGGGGGGGGF
ncbi:MAG: DUF2207 domain-containing protein [Gemmatimonadales bacterium]